MADDFEITGIDWTLVNQDAADWARDYAFDDFAEQITTTSREALQRLIPAYFEEGMTQGELSKALAGVFSPDRIEMIARTEVTRAASEGEQEIAAQLAAQGVQMQPVWQTRNDELVCEICGPRNGKKIGVDIMDEYPPAHPRCRCWVTHEFMESDTEEIYIGHMVPDANMSATARARFDGDIAINPDIYGSLKESEKEFVVAHELSHHTIEDYILKNNDEWDIAQEALMVTYVEERDRYLFVGGNTRIGEAISDSIAVYLTDGEFGGISIEKMEIVNLWAERTIKEAGYSTDYLQRTILRLLKEAEELL